MKAPFYKLWLEGKVNQDLTDYIDGLDYEDCVGEDNMVDFKVNLQKGFEMIKNGKVEAGSAMKFQFGFLGEMPSPIHTAVVKDLDVDYGTGGIKVSIRALDKGVDMKRSDSNKIWKKIRSSDVAIQIAKKYDLEVDVTPTVKVWDSMPQANRSDLEFLTYLAKRETNGNFITFISNNVLHFVNRGLDKGSKITYEWGNGDGELISFKTQHRESTSNKGTAKTTVSGFDTASKSGVTSVASNKTQKDETVLGEVKIKVDRYTGQPMGKTLLTPGGKGISIENKNLASSSKSKSDLKVLTATATVLGNPSLKANMVITIGGVLEKHCGNWFIQKAKHSVRTGGYLTTLELAKNGQKTGTAKNSDKAQKKNTTVGPKDNKVVINRIKGTRVN